ncbi:MAG: hypothetical protein ACSLE0_07180 [Chitinophagaceae bacterium]
MLPIFVKTKVINLVAAFTLSTILFSFSNGKGGEGFEIFLNNKLVIQQYGKEMNKVKSLSLDASSENDLLSIRYYHCGRVSKSKTITIRDDQDRVLKQWKFADVSDASATISCKVKDILSLRKGKSSSLKLYYSSSELPEGRLLTSIVTKEMNVAKL